MQAAIEPNFVYPLLRGRDVQRWKAEPSAYILLPNRTDKLAGIPEAEMKSKYPKTYAYLKRFEKQLRQRSGYRKFFKSTDPYWTMYDVGPYTLAPWKVVWPGEVAPSLRASVVNVYLNKPIVCDQTNYFVECSDETSSHFLCALLNSAVIRCYYKAVAYKHTSMHFIRDLSIPNFDSNDSTHKTLADLSQRCHEAAAKGLTDTVAQLEEEADKAAAKLWSITDDELMAIQEALKEMLGPKTQKR